MSLSTSGYSLSIASGMIVAFIFLYFFAKRKRFPDPIGLMIGIVFCFPFVFLGARLWTIFDPLFAEKLNQGTTWWSWLKVFFGFQNETILIEGLSLHGGLIFGAIYLYFFFCWYSKKYRYSMLTLFDFVIPGILIIQIFGRFGNFFNSEILGKIISKNYQKDFPNLPDFIAKFLRHSQDNNNTIRAPLFFYEIIGHLVIFFIIFFLPLFFRFISATPQRVLRNFNPNFESNGFNYRTKKIAKQTLNFSWWSWKYWLSRFLIYRFFRRSLLHNALFENHHNKKITATRLLPQVGLSKSFFVNSTIDNLSTASYFRYALLLNDIVYQNFFSRIWGRSKLFLRRNSAELVRYHTPFKFYTFRAGTRLALYLILTNFLRLFLQQKRVPSDVLSVTIPIVIIFLFLGFLLFFLAQWFLPSRIRSHHWIYEVDYSTKLNQN